MFFLLLVAQIWAIFSFFVLPSVVDAHRKRDAATSATNVDQHDHGASPEWIHRSNQTLQQRPLPVPLSTVNLNGKSIRTNTSECTSGDTNLGKRDTQATGTSTKGTFLVLARDAASAYSAYSGLNDYGIPYELVIVPATGAPLPTLKASNTVGNYGGIVVLSEISYENSAGQWASALTPDQWNALYDYQVNFGARMVRLDVVPSPLTGTTSLGACCDEGVEQFVSFSDVSHFPTAGLTVGATMSTIGLYHYPGTISNSSMATPIATFQSTSGSDPSVAAVINTFPGRQQMVFFMPFSTEWSITSTILAHSWIHWATRGLYAGYRRIMLNTQVDDVFLVTGTYSETSFRVSTADIATHIQWQGSIGKRLPPGSNYTMELGHNGNGNIEYTNDEISEEICEPTGPIEFDDPPPPDLEYMKPIGTGTTLWPSDRPKYQYSNTCISSDPLAKFFQNSNNRDSFMHLSHTFTHQDLNLATYTDTSNQISWNKAWMDQIGISKGKWFSGKGLIPPAITGLHNGDALHAWKDNGILNVVGDNTRSLLLNKDNEHWPLISTVAANGFDGIQITPRWASNIYYNCDTMECDTAEWMSFGNNGTFASILAIEKDANARHLLGLHHDAFMFHQANMRWEGVERHAPIGGVSGQYSLLQLWVETVVTEVTKHVNWPIISLKHDDLAVSFSQRAKRDACKYIITYQHAGTNIVGFTVSAPSVNNKCGAPIPVTVPMGVSSTKGYVTEQLGNDPLTIWVDLVGKEVSFSLKFAVPW